MYFTVWGTIIVCALLYGRSTGAITFTEALLALGVFMLMGLGGRLKG